MSGLAQCCKAQETSHDNYRRKDRSLRIGLRACHAWLAKQEETAEIEAQRGVHV
jgi:hypothetical protein